jgi:hypothetical protein
MQSRSRRVLVQRSRQSSERLRGDFAGHAGAHHAPPDQLFELRRVALVLARPGAEGQAVAEREHHRVRRKTLQLGAIGAAPDDEREQHPADRCHFRAHAIHSAADRASGRTEGA